MGPLINERGGRRLCWTGSSPIARAGRRDPVRRQALDRPGCFVEPTLVARAARHADPQGGDLRADPLPDRVRRRSTTPSGWHNDVPQGLSSAIFTTNLRSAETFLSATRQRLRHRQRQHRHQRAPRSAARSAARRTPAADASRAATPGRPTCGGRPTRSTGAAICRWRRACGSTCRESRTHDRPRIRREDPPALASRDEGAHGADGDAGGHRSRPRLQAAPDRRDHLAVRQVRHHLAAADRPQPAHGRRPRLRRHLAGGAVARDLARPRARPRRAAARRAARVQESPAVDGGAQGRLATSCRCATRATPGVDVPLPRGLVLRARLDHDRGLRPQPLHEAGRRPGLLDASRLVVGAARQPGGPASHLRRHEGRPAGHRAPGRELHRHPRSTRRSRRSCSSSRRCSR